MASVCKKRDVGRKRKFDGVEFEMTTRWKKTISDVAFMVFVHPLLVEKVAWP